MNQLIESVNLWCDKFLLPKYYVEQCPNHMIFLYQDYSKYNVIANIYYNTITKQYKVKSFNNQLNYCVNDMIDAIECINLISEHYELHGRVSEFVLYIKKQIIKNGYKDYSFSVNDYNDDDEWLINCINEL